MFELNQQSNPAQEKSGSQMPAPVDTIEIYSFRDLCNGGKSFIFDSENRQIKGSNLDALAKSLKNDTEFIEPLKVTPATVALAQGRNLIDFDGNPVTGATAGVENMYVILDGQHRHALLLEKPTIDCKVDILKPKDIKEYINIINNVRKSWDGSDRRHSVMAAHPNETQLLSAIEKYAKEWKVSSKYAECALTGDVDKFKSEMMKKELSDGGFDSKKYEVKAEDIERADNVMKLLLSIYPNEKRVKRVELMKAIMKIRPALSKKMKGDFNQLVLGFIQSFKGSQDSESLFQGLGSSNYNTHVLSLWNEFVERDDIEVLNNAAMATIQAYTAPVAPASKKPMKVNSGSTKEILEARSKQAQSKGKNATVKADSSASVTVQVQKTGSLVVQAEDAVETVVATDDGGAFVEVSAMREFEANKEDGYKKAPEE